MNRFRHALAAASAVAISAALVAPITAPIASADGNDASLAYFEGNWIDLTQGWGDATACNVTESGTTCYRTEEEMDAAIAEEGGAARALSTLCPSSLRLYNGTSYTGSMVQINITGTVVYLSAYGFDNLTSSYKVGACDAVLYTGGGSGGYPGNTSAFVQSPSMLSGYDNTISSVLM